MGLTTSKNLLLKLIGCHALHALAIFWLAEKRCKNTFSILHHLSPLILVNATLVAFVLLRSSSFHCRCYKQREPTPTQKSARKWQLRPFATSCAKDCEGHSLVQTSFAESPNRSLRVRRSKARLDCGATLQSTKT